MKYVGKEAEMFKVYTRKGKDGDERRGEKYVEHLCKAVKGRVVKAHGNSGVVVCRFERNLSPTEVNTRVYVKLYGAIEYEDD